MTRLHRTLACYAILFAAMAVLTACARPLRLQAVLGKNEVVAKGAPVFVDTTRAGTVVAVGEEGGERVADLAITVPEAKERLRVGAVRLVEEGRIQINTGAVKEGAVPLPQGARIPETSKVGYWVERYSEQSTLIVAGLAVVALVILWLVFRSLVGTIGLVLCVLLAGVATQAIQPYAVPWVERGLKYIGPPAQAPTMTARQPETPPTDSVITAPEKPAARVYKQAEETITEVMNTRPSPVVLTWCLVFVVLFIGFNIVLGRASRVWRK